METKDIKWCLPHGYPLPCYKCGMPLTEMQQKEIYKAGMQKVADFIKEHSNNEGYKGLFYYCIDLEPWQAFLKENGLGTKED